MGSLKCLFGWPFWRPGCLSWKFFIKCLGVVHMTKLHWPEFHTRMTFWFCIMFIWWWVISYLGYLNVHYMLIKYMCESNRKHYSCATHSSQLADRFDTETGGHFTFTWCHCEIFYLTPVQQPEWTHFRVTRNGMAFCDGIMYTDVEPWKGTRSELRPAWKSPCCNVNTPLE